MNGFKLDPSWHVRRFMAFSTILSCIALIIAGLVMGVDALEALVWPVCSVWGATVTIYIGGAVVDSFRSGRFGGPPPRYLSGGDDDNPYRQDV